MIFRVVCGTFDEYLGEWIERYASFRYLDLYRVVFRNNRYA